MSDLKFDKNRYRAKQCPCGRSNRDGKFTPYTGYDTAGYCHSCGQTFLPDQINGQPLFPEGNKKKPDAVTYIDKNLMHRTLTGDDNFTSWLQRIFPANQVAWLVRRYNIGTSKHWPGATVFWQVCRNNIVRGGKIMVYDPTTGRRNKQKFTWVHKLANIPNYELRQHLFGLHLMDENKPVAVVESEKSAIVCSMYFPDLVWMACGGLQGLTTEKLRPVRACRIILFPDANGFDTWNKKADEIRAALPGTHIAVSGLLEKKCTPTEKQAGLDIADFLLKTPWADFEAQQEKKHQALQKEKQILEASKNSPQDEYDFEILKDGSIVALTPEGYPAAWDQPSQNNKLYFFNR
ncbi:hypothetical protein A8C56_23555 [Niabella ginsenosidivorans]|uniref:DUF6371 domain-containing protein n=1 Tax=Niabella ginsenosidivorans TaxID=1176587 RepID=A0A1A9IA03_9BACT|nr:DUF6371 domain-containing protein [Niabella ginsenosidivorans]ANH83552.1 hypothetical protein A8C56_23555 [Niabella ginsenosidivorans]